MTQLILDTTGYGVVLPESQKDGYKAQFTPLHEDVEMITGRLVRELRGNVWVLGYQYGWFDTKMKNRVIAACEKGKRSPISCDFLKPDSDGVLSSSEFWVMAFNYPKFFWSRDDNGNPIPMWADFSLTLREVKPHD